MQLLGAQLRVLLLRGRELLLQAFELQARLGGLLGGLRTRFFQGTLLLFLLPLLALLGALVRRRRAPARAAAQRLGAGGLDAFQCMARETLSSENSCSHFGQVTRASGLRK